MASAPHRQWDRRVTEWEDNIKKIAYCACNVWDRKKMLIAIYKVLHSYTHNEDTRS